MNCEPAKHRRRSIRLKGYDYGQPGAYFVTVCTQHRACLFGDVVDGAMNLNNAGRLVATVWNDIPARFPSVELDAFVVMPNHIHGVILFVDDGMGTRTVPTEMAVGAPLVGAPVDRTNAPDRGTTTRAAPTVGDVVGAFKSLCTVAYIQGVKANRWTAFHSRLWQRNYYEHVIRDESELSRIRRYIDENPLRWEFDDENPQRTSSGCATPGTHIC